mgnify:CR=1 FL=1
MMSDVEKIVLLCRAMDLVVVFDIDDCCGVHDNLDSADSMGAAEKCGTADEVLDWLVDRAGRVAMRGVRAKRALGVLSA